MHNFVNFALFTPMGMKSEPESERRHFAMPEPLRMVRLCGDAGIIHKSHTVLYCSVADLDPVGSGLFLSDPDPDVWGVLALINDSVSTFLVCEKAINTIILK
jgi:hypothetical protein